MNLIINHIPPNWEPGNPEAIAKWIERIKTSITNSNDKKTTSRPL